MTLNEFYQYINNEKELYLLNSKTFWHIIPPYQILPNIDPNGLEWFAYHIMTGDTKCRTMIDLRYIIWNEEYIPYQYIFFINKQSAAMFKFGFEDIRD